MLQKFRNDKHFQRRAELNLSFKLNFYKLTHCQQICEQSKIALPLICKIFHQLNSVL